VVAGGGTAGRRQKEKLNEATSTQTYFCNSSLSVCARQSASVCVRNESNVPTTKDALRKKIED